MSGRKIFVLVSAALVGTMLSFPIAAESDGKLILSQTNETKPPQAARRFGRPIKKKTRTVGSLAACECSATNAVGKEEVYLCGAPMCDLDTKKEAICANGEWVSTDKTCQ
jgi:hypothetical protein